MLRAALTLFPVVPSLRRRPPSQPQFALPRHSARLVLSPLSAMLLAVAVLLTVGVGSASAWESVSKAEEEKYAEDGVSFIRHHESFASGPESLTVCVVYTCHNEGELTLPPGVYGYVFLDGAIPIADNHFCGTREGHPYCEGGPLGLPGFHFTFYKLANGLTPEGNVVEHEIGWAYRPIERKEEEETELLGGKNEGEPHREYCLRADPVNCATGNEVETQTDLVVGGRGPALKLTRTYNSLLAVKQTTHGPFGFGWTSSFGAYLEFNGEEAAAIVHQSNGSTVTFTGSDEAICDLEHQCNYSQPVGPWTAPSSLAEATLAEEGSGYVYTLPNQTKLYFNHEGQLESEVDRNGNALTMSYESGHLVAVTDGAGRKLTFTYNAEGEVESAADPMGHSVKYTYEYGNLKSVTQPAESALRWQFKYSERELTSETDGRGQTVTTEYDGSQQVASQTDALGRKYEWRYGGSESAPETTIVEPNGSETYERFNALYEPTRVTRAHGLPSLESTTEYEYDGAGDLIKATDPNRHVTEYTYDSEHNETSEKDPCGDETKWEYDSTHDVTGITRPDGEKTRIERDDDGNAIKVSRPAFGETSQVTKYKYDADGDLESMTNPLGKEWKYEYDGYGDRTAETDPEANKQTWGYNEDSQETSTVSPRGHVSGATESNFRTTIERDAQGRPVKITNPLGDAAKYTYDADGDLEKEVDPEGHTTSYSYNADDELTKTELPNKAITETEYNDEGQIVAQIDGNKHTTKYERNALGEVTEETNALGQRTTKEYNRAGNLTSITDAAKRTTTYKYDPANRLTEVAYSDGKTPDVEYEYNEDGDRTKMKDGTGETTYTYDQIDRLIESKDGHGETVKYEYDLANNPVKIIYPSGKAITRTYDNDDRLKTVTDWLEHTTSFAYSPDSDLTTTTYPSGTGDVDTDAYNDADAISEVTMKKGTETLASLAYTRNEDNEITKATIKGLPGEAKPGYTYDANSRLTKGAGTEYEYDNANNLTGIQKRTYSYNAADELEKDAMKKTTDNTYSFNEVGERTKTTLASGPATTYGYDQAGELTSVERPKEGETPEIKDSYAYNGEGLRASEATAGTTNYLTWDTAEVELPLILSNGTYSFIYGPQGMPIEQINNTSGEVLYLHHDEQGSTRLLTGSTGKVEGSFTYGPYGETTGHTGTATTPLGYDAQYTSSDTGLIYLRNRVYDPKTAQFLTVDPAVAFTGEPYSYASDNPLNESDPTGLGDWLGLGIPSPGEVGEEAGEAIAGWGDTITFGGTEWVREQLGDNNIDSCSGAYQGGGIAGLVTGALIPGEDDAEAAEIAGFTSHGLAQVIGREGVGVSDQALLDAVRDPENVIEQANGTTRYVGKDATVVLNGEKQVVTAWPNSSAGWRTQP
jgi:RHS repeat-associated protein